MRASVVLLRQSVYLGAESVAELHGNRPHFELQGPARGEPWTCLPEREVSPGLVWGWIKETSKRPLKFTIRKYICYG